MAALRDFQSALCAASLGIADRHIPASWVKDGDPMDRLAIHHNNTMLGLTDVLAGMFPVVVRLVGVDFFDMLAADFIKAHPPKHSALLFWGLDLPAFLLTYAPAQSLAYLSDVARLEAAWYRAYHAADSVAIDPNELMEFPQDQLEDLVFNLHPTLQVIASPFPILSIWNANQPEVQDAPVIDLTSGATTLAVIRPASQVNVTPLACGTFALVQALQHGQRLGIGWDAARTVQTDFSLAKELGFLLANGFFTQARLP